MQAQPHVVPSPISDQAYRQMVDSLVDYAIILLDGDGTITSWNRGAEQLKGYVSDDVLGLNFFQFFFRAEASDTSVDDVIAELARHGRFESEGWCRRKNGNSIWIHLTIQGAPPQDGSPGGYVAICRDRTLRRSAERVSRRTEDRFRQLLDGFRDHAICMLDADGLISGWSDELERMLGYRGTEVVGEPFSKLFSGEDRIAGAPDRTLTAALGRRRYEYHGCHQHRDGQLVPMSGIVDAIRGDDGSPAGFAVVMRDRSVQQETEQALVDARLALSQSQKLEMIGRLTGGFAHDFNNLLSAILGNLELSRRRMALDSEIRGFIDNAVIGAQRGAALVGRMMSFTRERPEWVRTVALPELIEGLGDLVFRTIGPNVTVQVSCSSPLAPVEVDPHQLELALINLIVNARDAMPTGGTIEIRARNRRIAGAAANGGARRYVELQVVDTGTGMDEQTLARASELFFTTKPAGKGTGLGLSMVQSYVDAVHGRMSIASRPGKGTTISLLLPAARRGGLGALADEDIEAEDLDNPPARHLRILVADDDALVLLNVVAMLSDLGHETVEAGSGQEALGILSNGGQPPIDLLITDHAMPRMTGVELAAAVKAQWPALPVILASGYSEDAIDYHPADGVLLRKPFGIRDLRGAIERAVRPDPLENAGEPGDGAAPPKAVLGASR